MKIGLISDIHANLSALQNALNLLHAQQVETILCAGDLVDGNSDGDKVAALIQAHAIPCVRGNHDHSTSSNQKWLRKMYRPDDPRIKGDLLSESTIAYVTSLPLILRFTFGETRLLLAHGTPRSNTDYLFPDVSDKEFAQVAIDAQADIVVLGHTHMTMCRHIHKTWIINPGSVDGNREEDRQTCGILETSPFSLTIYDINSGKIMRTCGEALNNSGKTQ